MRHPESTKEGFDFDWLDTTDYRVFGWMVINIALFSHIVIYQPPLWVTYLYNAILYGIGGLLAYRSVKLRRIFVLATVAGVIELGADYFLVSIAGTLVYPKSLPLIIKSPLYMPLAWAIVTTQLGYLALQLVSVEKRKAASVVPGGIAMSLIWFYETGASIAGIWEYTKAPLCMLGQAPVFIIVAEGIMFSTLFYFVERSKPVIAGIGFGLVIISSYIISYYMFILLGL